MENETNINVDNISKKNTKFIARRKKLGLTQLELAKELGVSESTIKHVESGERKLSDKLNRKMAEYENENFNLDMNHIFYEFKKAMIVMGADKSDAEIISKEIAIILKTGNSDKRKEYYHFIAETIMQYQLVCSVEKAGLKYNTEIDKLKNNAEALYNMILKSAENLIETPKESK